MLNGVGVDVLEEVRGVASGGWTMVTKVLGQRLIGLLFDPQILGWLKVIPKYRNYLLNLVVSIGVNKEIRVDFFFFFASPIQVKLNLNLATAGHWLSAFTS